MAVSQNWIADLLNGYRRVCNSVGTFFKSRNVVRFLGSVTITDNPNFVDDTGATVGSTDVTFSGGSGGAGQNPTSLINGLNSNIATNGQPTLRITGPSALFQVGGFAPTSSWSGGQILDIVNTTTQYMIIVHEDVNSTASNRIDTQGGAPVTLPPRKGSARFVYDGTSQRWVLQSVGLAYPRLFDPRDFGAPCNGRYFNTSNFRWYVDSLFTIEASDDAPGVQAAVNAAIAVGTGGVLIPSVPGGSLYFKTKQGSNGEFIRLSAGGITIRGEGADSLITIAPGFNTGASPVGYTTVFGNSDGGYSGTGVDLSDVRFTNFSVDHNALGNQWGGADYNSQAGPVCANCTVLVVKGTGVTMDHLYVRNTNGVFNLICGTYGGNGSDYTVTNFSVNYNRFENLHNDPNTGDASIIAVGAKWGEVTANRFTNTTNVGVTGSAFRPQATAMEVHGVNITTSKNLVQNMHRGCNTAGDSLSAKTITFEGNVFSQVDTGFTLFSIDGQGFDGLKIVGNNIGLIKSSLYTSMGTYAGINSEYYDGVGYGSGYTNTDISGNQIEWLDSASVPSNVIGINLAIGQSQTLTIERNQILGMGGEGISLTIGYPANHSPPNKLHDTYIVHNKVYNCGTYGIAVTGGAGDTAVQFQRLFVTDNEITDDRGGSSVLSIGVVVTAYTDSSCKVWNNDVTGFAIAAEFFDPTNYASQSNFYPSLKFAGVTALAAGLTTGTSEVVVVSNPTAATSGVPTQDTPGYAWHGSYYSSGNHAVDARMWVSTAGGTPTWFMDYFIDGAGYTIVAELSTAQWLLGTTALTLSNSGTVFWQTRITSGFACIYMAAAGIPGSPDLTNFILLASGSTTQLNTPVGGTGNCTYGGNMRFAWDSSFCYVAAPLKLTSQTVGSTSPSAGGAGALPATPAGYLAITINGTARQIPIY